MILMTGASGFVASHLIPKLKASGYQIRALVLNEREAEKVRGLGVETAIGNVADAASMKGAFTGIDMAIHLVAILRESKFATFESVNVGGTKNMLEAAKAAGVKRFIHFGILGANADPKYRYLNSKWRAMQAVKASGLDYTIFEPSVMFGKGAGFIDALLRSINLFPFIAPVAGSGKTLLQPIFVGDVADCVLAAVKGNKIRQECEVGGPEQMTYKNMMTTVMKAAGINKPRVHVPIAFMRPAVWVMERVSKNPPITKDELDALGLNNITEPDSVEKQFGFKPKKLDDGLDYLKSKK